MGRIPLRLEVVSGRDLVYPLAALLTFGLGALFGIVSADGFAAQGFGRIWFSRWHDVRRLAHENIFEEFAWRGYLTPRLDAAKVHPILNHLIVGILWWSWHLPYYYYFLDRSILISSITTSIPVFLAIGLLVLFPTAILFGELRLVSKSVWPVFVLHNVINALSMPLLINGFIKVNGPMAPIFTPTNEGIITSILFGAAGLMIYQYRMKRQ
ncbi:CPBP family intramembrane glutamic endopeptidase [Candidatus Villigracilis saccharophilus]|uniref:CPBP family intramembrane glutamic endopeptidase n=1 Tax=Candidatus Villigracilis saccharophilus TaxID=3140684 RepID=UPI003136C3CA|nr:CPBP family intramembrane metalloprotease [Anaerolineales bacterium]